MVLAARRPLWFDELFTLHIASLPDVAAVRRALELGIDHHPLPYWLVTRAALALAGDPALGVRLPALVGFAAAAVCLHLFVSRRTRPLYGLVAAAVPFATATVFYATEGRPYGLALGFASAALLAWQRAAEGSRRAVWLAALAIALAAAISTSYYAVLVVAPLAVGEIVRTARAGRLDAPTWGALAAGSAVSLAYLPGISGSLARLGGPNWAEPHAAAVPRMYLDLFGGLSLTVVAVLGLAGAFLAAEPSASAPARRRPPPLELAAAVGFLALPFVAWAAAELVTNRLTARYALAAVLGLAVLAAFVAFVVGRGSSLLGLALLAVLVTGYAGELALAWRRAGEHREQLRALPALLAEAPGGLPVAVDDPLRALELMHHAPAPV
ncbi:MAG TPA: glycosyltransferase family 39 protein, partial [Gemmatimonadota bacterium]